MSSNNSINLTTANIFIDNIFSGKAFAEFLQQDIKNRTEKCLKKHIKPGLAVIIVGNDPASQVYVKNKVTTAEKLGYHSVLEEYDDTLTQEKLITHINRLNQDEKIHGILVQLPLPAHINSQAVIKTISPNKDVDGFHVMNAGSLMVGQPLFQPCTPYGVMKILDYYTQEILKLDEEHAKRWFFGKHAVIVGASNIVGKPQAMMLLNRSCTITVCNSKTIDLKQHTRQADIIIMAAGRPNLLTADMIGIDKKPVVIDVGINRDKNGKLCGDVDFKTVQPLTSLITPVPGGVGPMTITLLLLNTLEAVERLLGINK
jgi:methylenetetrahydrofolate dehydrogenase (NADP+)/methenyltetrahydrofolate cyclohydrolase